MAGVRGPLRAGEDVERPRGDELGFLSRSLSLAIHVVAHRMQSWLCNLLKTTLVSVFAMLLNDTASRQRRPAMTPTLGSRATSGQRNCNGDKARTDLYSSQRRLPTTPL